MDKIGEKHDSGKLLFGCLTQGLAPVLKGVVAVLTYGAKKYKRDSWQSVPNGRQRYMEALDRHLNKINLGQFKDRESGLPHVFHVVCNAMFVAHFDILSKGPEIFKFKQPPEKK